MEEWKSSLDEFSRWKVDEVRKYLSMHEEGTTKKRKPKLFLVAHTVSEQGLPIVPSTMHHVEQADINHRDQHIAWSKDTGRWLDVHSVPAVPQSSAPAARRPKAAATGNATQL